MKIGRVICLAAFLVALPIVGCTQTSTSDDSMAPAPAPAPAQKSSKLDSQLLALHAEFEVYIESGASPDTFDSVQRALSFKDGAVLIDAIASNDVSVLRDELESAGATVLASAGLTVSCYFPVEGLSRLETLPGLRHARASVAITR